MALSKPKIRLSRVTIIRIAEFAIIALIIGASLWTIAYTYTTLINMDNSTAVSDATTDVKFEKLDTGRISKIFNVISAATSPVEERPLSRDPFVKVLAPEPPASEPPPVEEPAEQPPIEQPITESGGLDTGTTAE